MFRNREIICAVEFGTSKISVLIGDVGGDGRLEIIGRSTVPAGGSVVKGEVCDMEKALRLLNQALEEADKASGGELANTVLVTVLVTGCGIDSQPGVGSVFIKNPEQIVTENECGEAFENARVLALSAERELINSSESFWMVDGRRVSNPLRHNGGKLEAHIHIVHAISARIENFRSLIRDSGFENATLDVAFAPLAADIGILSDKERENGVLLVDVGAGCTEYLVEYDRGIIASGVIQIGFEHVANDLSIALDLHVDLCRRLIESGAIARAAADKREYLEFKNSTGNIRRIPLASFETVIDLRLRELFEVIRRRIVAAGVPRSLGAGGVLTGGGALYPRTRELFREVFELSCRIGRPTDAGGAVTDIENPRFSAVWGALKVASGYLAQYSTPRRSMFGSMIDKLNHVWDSGRRNLHNLKETIKF